MSDVTPDESKPTVIWIVAVIFIFLWLGLLMGGYFWAHRPYDSGLGRVAGGSLALLAKDFGQAQMGVIVRAVGNTLLSIITWLTVTWLAAALGQRLLGHLWADEETAVRLIFASGTGLGFLSLLVWVLGIVGLLRPLAAYLLLLILIGLLFPTMKTIWQEVRSLSRPRPQDGFQRLILIYSAITLLLIFLVALAPPFAWDSLTYHLTGARLNIEAGRFVHPVDIPQQGFPLLVQLQYTLAMLLVGDGPATLFHFSYGLLSLAVTAVFTRRLFNSNAAWSAIMILLSVGSIHSLMSWPYVDLALLFYITAAFYTFWRWRETRQERWLLLLGLMCGFCMGVKYTAVLVPIALGLDLVWESRPEDLPIIIRRLGLVALIATLVTVPWLIENWLTTGNPLYPFVFNGKFWNEWRTWWYGRPGTGLAATNPWLLLIVPIHATIISIEGTNFYDATLGPFALGLLFILPVVWHQFDQKAKTVLCHLLVFFLINYAFWLYGLATSAFLFQGRLLLPMFGITAVIGGATLDRIQALNRPELNISWMSRVLISLTLIGILFTNVLTFIISNPLSVLIGLETESRFLTRHLGHYQEAIEDINNLPAAARVIFLWETRSYGCQVICDPDPILDRFLRLTQYEGLDAAGIAQQWHEAGFTHVFWSKTGYDFLLDAAATRDHPMGRLIRPEDKVILQDLQTNYLSVVGEWADAYVLYRLNP